MKILSIRQPWAWLILHAGKDIENRTWSTNYRGPFLIHASNMMTHREYAEACLWVLNNIGLSITVPRYDALPRGGIVGIAMIKECVTSSSSPWFCGPFGFVLVNAISLPFVPCKGALGIRTAEDGIADVCSKNLTSLVRSQNEKLHQCAVRAMRAKS